MNTTQQTIDLTPFCYPDGDARYAIDKPWVRGGFRYATDGRIIVRVPAEGEPDVSDGKKRPKASEIFKPVSGEWQNWPKVIACSECNGVGNIVCPGCKCGACLGDCNVECEACHKPGSFKTLFGKAQLALHFAWIVSRLPSPMFLPPTKSVDGMVRFKFDGGEGAVMPFKG